MYKGNKDENCHGQRSIQHKIITLTCKLNIELKKKLIRCYVWNIVLYGSETWTLRKLERKYLESSEMWNWMKMQKITNEELLERI